MPMSSFADSEVTFAAAASATEVIVCRSGFKFAEPKIFLYSEVKFAAQHGPMPPTSSFTEVDLSS